MEPYGTIKGADNVGGISLAEINTGIKEFFVNIAEHKYATRRVLLHRHHRDPQRRSDKCDLRVPVVLFLFLRVREYAVTKMNADCLLHRMYAVVF